MTDELRRQLAEIEARGQHAERARELLEAAAIEPGPLSIRQIVAAGFLYLGQVVEDVAAR